MCLSCWFLNKSSLSLSCWFLNKSWRFSGGNENSIRRERRGEALMITTEREMEIRGEWTWSIV